MQKTWEISGHYAHWKVTVTVEPPTHEPDDFDVPEWPRTYFDPVAAHFVDAVNYYELSRDAERPSR